MSSVDAFAVLLAILLVVPPLASLMGRRRGDDPDRNHRNHDEGDR